MHLSSPADVVFDAGFGHFDPIPEGAIENEDGSITMRPNSDGKISPFPNVTWQGHELCAWYDYTYNTFDENTIFTEGTSLEARYVIPEIKVSKIWEDSDDIDGLRPESITVDLQALSSSMARKTTLSEENDWTGSFEDVFDYFNFPFSVKEIDLPDTYI